MNKVTLEQNLQKAMGIERIGMLEDFKLYILPILEKLSSPQYVDPIGKTPEEYNHLLNINNLQAKIYTDLIRLFTTQNITIENIRKQLEKPVTKYGV